MAANDTVGDSIQMEVLGNSKQVSPIDQDNYKSEDDCFSPGPCDEGLANNLSVTSNQGTETVWKIGCYKINPSTTAGI